jgi:hypothetical protein
MCFSAGASFAGGALITTIGVLTVRKNSEPSRRVFAAMPLIFGVQQISEGFVWVALQSPGHEMMSGIAACIFLFAAVILWPVYVPLSVLLMEKEQGSRRIMFPLLFIGLLVSAYYAVRLLTSEIYPVISSHHIKYTGEFPRTWALAVFSGYLIATLVPFFISTRRRMWILGLLMALSCLVTGIFYKEYLTSVSCFFAALISITVWYIISAGPAQGEVKDGKIS